LQFVTLYKTQTYQKVSGQEDDALPNQAKVESGVFIGGTFLKD
jgi:hypothetical protein